MDIYNDDLEILFEKWVMPGELPSSLHIVNWLTQSKMDAHKIIEQKTKNDL